MKHGVRYNEDYEFKDSRGAYEFDLSPKDHATMEWLSDRGYDAELFDLCGIEAGAEDEHGHEFEPDDIDHAQFFRYHLPHKHAPTYIAAIEDDPHAYLTCNGSSSLAVTLSELEQQVRRRLE